MIEIKRQGTTIFTLEDYGEGSSVSCQLMEHHYVTLKFSTESPVYFQLGDYVELPSFGLFKLISAYFPTQNTTTGGYDYELRLDAYYWEWQNKICKYRPKLSANETSFELTASIAYHAQIVLDNLSALDYTYNGKEYSVDYTTYNKDVFDADKAFHVSYNSISVLDAMNAWCEALDCEWWVDGSVIYLGYCEMIGQVTFQSDDNMVSMSQSESKSDYATRLYAFGSDKNIPDGYYTGEDADVTINGVASEYLMLPDKEDEDGFVAKNGYIENTNLVTCEEQAVEGVVMFEDEYPKVKCTVSDIKTYTSTAEDDEGKEYTQTFYQVADTESSFTSSFEKGWIKDNLTLMIKFESGSMNGMEFECAFKTIDGVNYFECIVNDTYGRDLPDTSLHPKVGDEFVLYNWDASKLTDTPLIEEAQEALYVRAKNYYKKSMIDPSNFTCVMDSKKFYNKGTINYHPLGEQVKLIHPMFSDVDDAGNHYRNSRIIGFDLSLDITYDSPKYIVGEKASYSRLGQLEDTVNSITVNGKTYAGGSSSGGSGNGGGSSVYVIGTNDVTPATDSNVYSARRSDLTYLDKTRDDVVSGKPSFRKGMHIGSSESSYDIDENGNAILADVTTSRIHDAGSTEEDRVIAGAEGYDIYMGTDGKSHMYIDYLNVRNRAVFSALEIRKVSYSGGVLLLSQAGSTLARVDEIKSADGGAVVAYKCWATADDGTTATQNWWKAGMMALSQTFNVKAGHYANTGNRYWWRLVVDAGQETLEDGKLYDYFTVSNVEKFQGSAANVPHTDTDEETGEKTTAWTSLAARMLEQDGYETDTDGTNITGRYFYGMDTDSDAPKVGDVAVQAGDQVRWTARGNVVKITTSAEDGAEENAPAMVMYHGMGAPYTTGVKDASGEETVSPYQWKTITRLDSPGKTYVNSDNFVWFSGSLDNTIEPIATWLSITPSESTIVRHADGTTTPEEITLSLRKYRGNTTTVVTEGVEWSASWTDTDGAEHKDVELPNGVLTEAGSLSKMDGTVEVKAAYDGMEASVGIPVLKDAEGEDAVQVDVLTDKGTTLRPTLTETTLTAYVTKGGEDVSDQLAPHCYSWTRVSEDTASDTTWNQLHSGVGRSITVTKAEVFRQSLFECTVDTTSLYGD